MPLHIHEFFHLSLSLFAGWIAWIVTGNPYVFIPALIGGVLVDIDHLIDYFFAYGTNFKLSYFMRGRQFHKSNKTYILFHSWELVFILFILTFQLSDLLTLRPLFLSFSFAYFLHLLFDSLINHMRAPSYFLLYRLVKKFDLKTLVTDKHYREHIKQK